LAGEERTALSAGVDLLSGKRQGQEAKESIDKGDQSREREPNSLVKGKVAPDVEKEQPEGPFVATGEEKHIPSCKSIHW